MMDGEMQRSRISSAFVPWGKINKNKTVSYRFIAHISLYMLLTIYTKEEFYSFYSFLIVYFHMWNPELIQEELIIEKFKLQSLDHFPSLFVYPVCCFMFPGRFQVNRKYERKIVDKKKRER